MRNHIPTLSLTLITLFSYVYIEFSYAWPQHQHHKRDRQHANAPGITHDLDFSCIDLPLNLSVPDTQPASHKIVNLNPTIQVPVPQITKPNVETIHPTSLPQGELPAQTVKELRSKLHSRLHRNVHQRGLGKRGYDIITKTVEVIVTVLPTEAVTSPQLLYLQTISTSARTSPVFASPSHQANSEVISSSVIKGDDLSYKAKEIFTRTTTSPIASVSSTMTSSICPASNGTMYTSNDGSRYQIICNTNVVGSDLPFQLVATFEECVAKCDSFNANAGNHQCVAAVFLPRRSKDADDCYLKYSTENLELSVGIIEAAFLQTTSKPVLSSSSSKLPILVYSRATPTSQITTTDQSASTFSAAAATPSPPGPAVIYATDKTIVTPEVAESHLHGPTRNHPTNQFIEWKSPADLSLVKNLLKVGIDGDLSVNYGISLDTGVLELNSSTQSLLAYLTDTPHLSRDGGKGGYLNGQHLFVFCDTGSYTTTTDTTNGNFLGFVSSSCATDIGMNGLQGDPLYLEDGIGAWSDNVGRMRGFAPMTRGEQSYNLAMQGNGQRYAIWPEASILVIDAETALLYAPIVYDDVNMETKATVFTYTGATLLSVTAGGLGGPIAERIVDKLFNQDEVEWGCSGGIRSWGPSGVGGKDGQVYVFGSVSGGLLLARTGYDNVTDRNSYEYWTGSEWNSGMQSASSKAFFLNGPILDVDIFYSPRHLTFIVVYLTIYADSVFYYRYLKADQAIIPPYAPGGNPTSDYVENIVKYDWSDEYVLYKAKPGLSGKYIYSGGVHQGYFGTDDIINGGSKMLISWTAPTGLNPATEESEYQIITAEIDWA